jgi:hypothetical protein
MQELKQALKEDLKEMCQELPLFLWHITPYIIGLCATAWVMNHVQVVMR